MVIARQDYRILNQGYFPKVTEMRKVVVQKAILIEEQGFSNSKPLARPAALPWSSNHHKHSDE